MKIAVNTRLLLAGKLEGIGRFSYETIKRTVLQHPEHEFHFLFDRPFAAEFIFAKNVIPHVIAPPARHPFLWYAWFEWAVPRKLNQLNPSLFISTDGYLSLATKVPTHLTIHDISFEHYPNAVPFWVRKYYQHYAPKFAQKASQIATVSEFTKSDVQQHYAIERAKMDVVYNGISDYFIPIDAIKKTQIQKDLTQGQPYFVCVSSLHPRKNIIGLLKAFDWFKKTTNSTAKLVLIGDFMFEKGPITSVLNSLTFKQEVLLTGSLSHQKIASIVAGSLAMVYVSFFEGFGIPIIEAMRCQVPVITSNVNSMAEVAGDSALLVDPHNVEAIAKAMQSIVENPMLVKDLVTKGMERQSNFSWDKTAHLFWNSIEKIQL